MTSRESSTVADPTRTIVILTALAEERNAVRARLAPWRTWVHPAGSRYDIAPLATPDWRIALGSTGRGNLSAAALTERAIASFAPEAVLHVGIAGSLRPHVGLGDIVVATEVYAIHSGRDDADMFRVRPRSWPASHALLQLAEDMAGDVEQFGLHAGTGWRQQLPIHFAPIAAGEVVLNSSGSALAHLLRDYYNDAAAIDTEDAGCAQAGHLSRSTPTLAVRGISDIADGHRDRTAHGEWRNVGATNAAIFALAMADRHAADTAISPDSTANRASGATIRRPPRCSECLRRQRQR